MSYNFKKKLLVIEWVVLLGFIGIVAVCMLIYPDRNGNPGGYRFCYEFVSALGMTVTSKGVNNFLPSLLFNIGLGLSVVLLIPFWYFRSRCISGHRFWQWAAFAGCSWFSLGILGVGLTPYNLYPDLHNFCVYSAFVAAVPGGFLMLLKTGHPYYSYPQKWWGLALVTVVLLSCFTVQFLMLHHLLPSRPTAPVIQKAYILTFIVWVAVEFKFYYRYMEIKKAGQPEACCIFQE
jgi:hypothetical protein